MELPRRALSESQQQPKGSVWNGHAESRDAGLRFGEKPGQQDGREPFPAPGHTGAEQSKDGRSQSNTGRSRGQ